MVLKNNYHKIMENVQVSNEMHDRIMKNINERDYNNQNQNQNYKVLSINKYKKYISIAACFAVLLVGVITIPNIINTTPEPPVQGISDIKECSSASELSQTVGFEVYEVKSIPFDTEEIQYTSYWKEMAEIVYMNSDETLTFRMSMGDEDISGDYNDIKNCLVSNLNVTIKGNNNKYCLAIWQNDGFTYSININKAISETEMLDIFKSVKN